MSKLDESKQEHECVALAENSDAHEPLYMVHSNKGTHWYDYCGACGYVNLNDTIQQLIQEARIDEVEKLDYEPQMHGDWQQVIIDRLAELKKGQDE